MNIKVICHQGFTLLPAMIAVWSWEGTHACRRTHKRSDITCRRRFYISSQLIETYRCARIVSVLVGNIDATGQVLIGAIIWRYRECSPECRPAVHTSCRYAGRRTCQILGTSLPPALRDAIPAISFGKHATQTILSKPPWHSWGQWGNYFSAKQPWLFRLCWLAGLSNSDHDLLVPVLCPAYRFTDLCLASEPGIILGFAWNCSRKG